jgi:F-type H+-transporting ATPase subunit gamma
MQTQETLKRRMNSTKDMKSIVKTMKSLAAVSIRQYERAVESLTEFTQTIELGLQVVLRERQVPGSALITSGGKTAAVVFGSDQGMVGQFNDEVALFAVQTMDKFKTRAGERLFLCIGDRVSVRLEDFGQPVQGVLRVPSAVSGIGWVVQEILFILDAWRRDESVSHVFLFHHTPVGGSSSKPRSVTLLPVGAQRFEDLGKRKWESRSLPWYSMKRETLFGALVRQFVYVLLYRAHAESLASENAQRLAAMQAAEKNIDERLDELTVQYHRVRQSAITSELLDITAGFEALRTGGIA